MSRKGIVALTFALALALPAAAGAASPSPWAGLARWLAAWSWRQGINPSPSSPWRRDVADAIDRGTRIDPQGRPCPGACRQTTLEPAGTDQDASLDPYGLARGLGIDPYGHP